MSTTIVCPHCRRETGQFVVRCDGHRFETHRCPDHGDVMPIKMPVSANRPVQVLMQTGIQGHGWSGEGP